MSDDHEVNEIGRWYQYLIYSDKMKKFLTKWMLTNQYNVDDAEENEHQYFNYASDKHYINIKASNNYISLWHVEVAPKGRAWLDEQRS